MRNSSLDCSGFMNNPDNSHECDKCPAYTDTACGASYGHRLPCGGTECFVDIQCRIRRLMESLA